MSVQRSNLRVMTTARLNAIGLMAADLGRSAAFYRALGYEVPEPTPESGGHLDIDLGGFRLMLDSEEVIRSFDPNASGDGKGRLSLAVECSGPAEVDRRHAELSALGSGSYLEPFDAFWGQRYATVLDPDGVHVDLYAPLVPES
jgi:uncharacterized glyoxalase superfamily protein PhnB